MSNEHAHDEHGHDGHHDDHGDPCGDGYLVHAHITPVKTNLIIISILFALTGLTVAVYFQNLGELNLVVALVIASIKATLVGTWFMHLKYEKAFNISFFLGALLFMAITTLLQERSLIIESRREQLATAVQSAHSIVAAFQAKAASGAMSQDRKSVV
mgnify:CR=1 FL=1